MEQNLHSPEVYDYRQYDRIWQRVAPDLEPYPGFRSAAVPALAELPGQAVQPPVPAAPAVPAAPDVPPVPAVPAEPAEQAAPLTPAQEAELPGAFPNPCCMGTAAEEMLAVLEGFIEEELADRRYYLALSRQAPAWARQRIRDLAAESAGRARRLMAVYYLITGGCYQAAVSRDRIFTGAWCPALRERYHVEACNAMNYYRAAEGTTDPCLARLLKDLGEESYRDADVLLTMLERSLGGK